MIALWAVMDRLIMLVKMFITANTINEEGKIQNVNVRFIDERKDAQIYVKAVVPTGGGLAKSSP